MNLQLSTDELRTIVTALGPECDRLNRIAQGITTPNFQRQAILRAGKCSDLRDRLRHMMKHGPGLHRVGACFGRGKKKPVEAQP